MMTLVRPLIVVREATVDDNPAILAMRDASRRPFVGNVEVPTGLTWFVAEREGRIVATVGFANAPERRMIVTDLYDDGTRAGKRGLVMLLLELASARAKLFFNVPLDRPGLLFALQKRGAILKAWAMEYET